MNWDNARFFLAVARTGTLRGAAQRLCVDQATVGRRVAGLEEELSAKLFLRTSTALVLTPAGEALLAPAEAMEQAAHAIERRVAGIDAQLAGTIRVATTDTMAATFVLPAIAQLRQRHPGIDVVCMASKSIANLTKREADVAVRTLRPDAPDLIARRIGHMETGVYASRGYVARAASPKREAPLRATTSCFTRATKCHGCGTTSAASPSRAAGSCCRAIRRPHSSRRWPRAWGSPNWYAAVPRPIRNSCVFCRTAAACRTCGSSRMPICTRPRASGR